LGVIIGVATVNASVTLRVKAVVLVTPPPADVTVIGKLPAGVDPVVTMLNTVEHDGLQEVEEKDPVAPAGSTDTLKETGWLLPKSTRSQSNWLKSRQRPIYPGVGEQKLKGWITEVATVWDAAIESCW
jgi:hypothetical protein